MFNLVVGPGVKTAALFMSVMATLAFGAPMIEVDSADYNVGVIQEGSVKVVKHDFKIRNTGDKPLKIEKVSPG